MTDDESAERDELRDEVDRLRERILELEGELVDPRCGACGRPMELVPTCECATVGGGGTPTPPE